MVRRGIQAGLLLMLAACGGGSGSSNAQPSNPQPGNPPPSAGPAFVTTPVAAFDSPWAMAFLPGSNLAIVTEKPGRLWLVDITNGSKQAVSGAPAVVLSSQGGLLDVKLSPTFATDNQVYLTYSERSAPGGSSLALARAQLVRDASGARLQNLGVLWHDPAGGQGGQFGAIIAFAPDGKSLFLSSGERQRFTPAQDRNQPLGKILHLTLDGKPAPGNPMAGQTGAATMMVTDPPANTEDAKTASGRSFTWPGPNLTPSETWSSGHRNPYGLTFDAQGRLWETEMGPRGGDELNLILPGKNYGWPIVSNGDNYSGQPIPDHPSRPDLEAPKLWWNPSISPGGMIYYSGIMFPAYKGSLFIAAMSTPGLIRVTLSGDTATAADFWDFGTRIRDVAQAPDGSIWLLEDGEEGSGGRLMRLTPKG